MAEARFQIFTRRHGRVEWRLMGANNWVLGLGGAPAESTEQTLRSVHRLKADLGTARDDIFLDGSGGWRWQLRSGDDVLAAGYRVFRRRGECRATLARFREVAAVAPVDEVLRVFR